MFLFIAIFKIVTDDDRGFFFFQTLILETIVNYMNVLNVHVIIRSIIVQMQKKGAKHFRHQIIKSFLLLHQQLRCKSRFNLPFVNLSIAAVHVMIGQCLRGEHRISNVTAPMLPAQRFTSIFSIGVVILVIAIALFVTTDIFSVFGFIIILHFVVSVCTSFIFSIRLR